MTITILEMNTMITIDIIMIHSWCNEMNCGFKKHFKIQIAPCILVDRVLVLDVSVLYVLEYLVQHYALYL